MRETLEWSLKSALPPGLVEEFLGRLSSAPVPSKSTMSRSCLALDVGYMLWQRENGPVHVDRGLLWDSSPQSGRDWFISEYRYMRKDTSHATIRGTLVFLHDASRRLLELASRMGSLEQEHDEDDLGADDAESLREEAARLSQAMNSLVGFHLLPLQVLGQQRSSIDDNYIVC